jgi:hypothetical protein
MKTKTRIAAAIAGSLGFALAAAPMYAQHHGMGPGMMMHGGPHGGGGGHGPMAGPVRMLTRQDSGSAADMALVHALLMNHASIRRSVTNLPDGIRTVTESDDPRVAQAIKTHVASMSGRLDEGREFNIFSTSLPVLFDNREKIRSSMEMTERGAVVIRRSSDAEVAAALQAHAGEVNELVKDGMRRGMMARMSLGPERFRANRDAGGSPSTPAPEHSH